MGLAASCPIIPWLRWFTIASREEISHLADFAVVFLLFTIGIELSWERLRILRRLVFGLGSLQVLICTLAIAAIAYLVVGRVTAAVFAGLVLALSSTAIVVPVLAEAKRLNAPAGRASFSVLLFQDLAVAPILFAITVLGAGEQTNMFASFLFALAQAAFAIVILVFIGRLALRPLFQQVAQTRSPELFVAASLLVVLGTGLIAAMSGLSMALGAFIAGLLLAETEYRRAVDATIQPFKGLLLGVFFVTVGMGLDVSRLFAAPLADPGDRRRSRRGQDHRHLRARTALQPVAGRRLRDGAAARARGRVRLRHRRQRRCRRARARRGRTKSPARDDPDHGHDSGTGAAWPQIRPSPQGEASLRTRPRRCRRHPTRRVTSSLLASAASANSSAICCRATRCRYLAIDADPKRVGAERRAGKPVYYRRQLAASSSCEPAASSGRAASWSRSTRRAPSKRSSPQSGRSGRT